MISIIILDSFLTLVSSLTSFFFNLYSHNLIAILSFAELFELFFDSNKLLFAGRLFDDWSFRVPFLFYDEPPLSSISLSAVIDLRLWNMVSSLAFFFFFFVVVLKSPPV